MFEPRLFTKLIYLWAMLAGLEADVENKTLVPSSDFPEKCVDLNFDISATG